MKDPNYVAKIEKAIADKYGHQTIQNPKSSWNTTKEQEYLEQLKQKERQIRNKEKEEETIENKSKIVRECQTCKKYRIKRKHDIYFTKFECCFDCYIQWIEGREERWKSGWRPK